MASMSKAKPEKKVLPRRFYKIVDVQQQNAAFCIALDGKLLRTQGRNMLQLPDAALANAIAAEWDAQTVHIDPDTMPLTRLANLTIDRAHIDRAAWLDDIARYVETDLLCYRAPAENDRLVTMQLQHFDPILAWAAGQGVKLEITDGLMPINQPAESQATLRSIFESASDGELAALAMLVPLLGSAVLVWALWKGQVSIEQALIAARLDEVAQAEQWGPDAEAEAAWANKCADAKAAAVFLAAMGKNAK